MRRLDILIILLVMSLLLGAFGCAKPAPATTPAPKPAAPAAPVVLKISYDAPGLMDNARHRWGAMVKDILERESKGRLKVELYPAGQIYNDPDSIVAVADGSIFASVASSNLLTPWDFSLNIFELPGVFADANHMGRFFASDKGGKELGRRLEKKGLIITWYSMAPGYIWTKKKVATLADLKGVKIRTVPAEVAKASMEVLGASAVPMAMGELVTSLQQGLLDGVMTLETAIYTRKLEELVRFVLANPSVMIYNGSPVMSKVQLDKMPQDLRDLCLSTADTASKAMDEFSQDVAKGYRKDYSAKGVVYTDADSAEIPKFRQAWKSVIDKYSEQVGRDLLAEAERLR